MNSRIIDYLTRLHARWGYITSERRKSDWLLYDEMVCYNSLHEIVNGVPNEEMKEYYVPMDKDQKGLRGKVLSELLRNIDDSIDVSEKEDEKVMDKLSKLIDKLSIQNAHELSENVKRIGNIIRFISGLGNMTLKENFIREINKDSGILYTLAKRGCQCSEYTAAMGEQLGESSPSFVS